MGTGQMMITVAAIFLLGMVILTVNRGYLENNMIMIESQVEIMAVSVGNSILDDVSSLAFDENTVSRIAITNLNQLSSIGSDSGEFLTSLRNNNYDDFDDFDGDTLIYSDSAAFIPEFKITFTAGYVDVRNNSFEFVTGPTWYKRLDLKISGEAMTDTIKLSKITSYFF